MSTYNIYVFNFYFYFHFTWSKFKQTFYKNLKELLKSIGKLVFDFKYRHFEKVFKYLGTLDCYALLYV